MSIKESALTAITSISNSDFVRAVTSAGASRRITVANLAKQIVEGYAGSSLAGSSQSVKSAIDSLNSNAIFYQYTTTSFSALDNILESNDRPKPFIADVTENTSTEKPGGSNHYTVIGWMNGTFKYGYQIAITFDGKIYKRIRNNSTAWGSWLSITLS